MSDIPEAMRQLKKARSILANVAKLLPREKPVKKAKPTATKMTKTLARQIIKYARYNPSASNRAIGRLFNVDGGRVSEALTGKRWK